MPLGVVDDGILTRSDALYGLRAINMVAVSLAIVAQYPLGHLGRMAYLEGDLNLGALAWSHDTGILLSLLLAREPRPRVKADELAAVEVDVMSILILGVVTLTHEDNIAFNVFLDYEPRPTTQAKPFALTYGMEPIAIVLPKYFAGLALDDPPRFRAEGATNEFIIVHLAEEADALAVFTVCARELRLLCNLSHLTLEQMPCGEEELGDLSEVDLR